MGRMLIDARMMRDLGVILISYAAAVLCTRSYWVTGAGGREARFG